MLQEYLRQARHVLVQIYRGQQIKFKLLACFHIKIIVRVDEAENIWHTLYKHSIFLVSLSMYVAFLISALYYAYNVLEIVQSA